MRNANSTSTFGMRARAAALVLMLLVAQAFTVTHPFDADAHPGGDPCALCVAITDLGSGAASSVATLVVDAPRLTSCAAFEPVIRSRPHVHCFARGPPAVS